MPIKSYRELAEEQAAYYESVKQRERYSIDLLTRLLPHLPLRDFGFGELPPMPWYGRVRSWLADRLLDWSETLESWAWRVNYHAKSARPSQPVNTGMTVMWRKWGNLPLTHDETPDVLDGGTE